MKKMGCFLLLLLLSVQARAAGKAAAPFLSLGNGARATGMGEAQTGLADGVSAVYWNPAGLGLTNSSELTLTHMQHFEDVTHQYAALALPLKKGRHGSLGISLTRFSVENIEGRDGTNEITGSLDEKDTSIQLSYGTRLWGSGREFGREGLYLGAGIKRIEENLTGVKSDTFGFDAGLQYRPGQLMVKRLGEWTRRLSLGFSIVNAGKGLTFDTVESPLPQETRFGFGYTHFLWGDALNIAMDAVKSRDGSDHLCGGGEFWVKNMLAFRLGYRSGQDAGSGLRVGAGFRFQAMDMDYAWAGFGEELGDTHRFTLSFSFGEGASSARRGLKSELIEFHLSRAQDKLQEGSFHEAVLEANHVLDIDPRNSSALHILIEAGEKLKPADPLPEPAKGDATDDDPTQ